MLVSKKGILAAAVAGAAIGLIISSYEEKAERKRVAQEITGMVAIIGLSYLAARRGAQIGAQKTIVQVYLQRKDDSSKYQELRSLPI